jgi:hypothetical protein
MTPTDFEHPPSYLVLGATGSISVPRERDAIGPG